VDIEMYEKRRWPLEPPDPVDAILLVMDQRGLKRLDLQEYPGGRCRVSEVPARKRGPSIRMIRALHDGLGVPLEVKSTPALRPAAAQLPGRCAST
jgi:HTH-type transcriptional regulator / antitoxin HigA